MERLISKIGVNDPSISRINTKVRCLPFLECRYSPHQVINNKSIGMVALRAITCDPDNRMDGATSRNKPAK